MVLSTSTDTVLPYIGHQLRTPLAAILGSTEMMFDSQQPLKERLQCLNNICRNVAALADLADQLTGKSETQVEFSWMPFLAEVVETCRAQAWKQGLQLKVQFGYQMPSTIQAHPKRLRQVLCSIIGEKIAATERGEVHVTFSSYIGREVPPHHRILMSVHSFFPDPIHALSTGQKNSWWELLKRQAEEMGGRIYNPLPNPVGTQDQFFSFPVGRVAQLQFMDSVSERDLRPNSKTVEFGDKKPLSNHRILVIEDSRETQLLLSQLLQKFGATVEVASDGGQGLRFALEHSFDIILLDLELPLMNGYEVVKEIRREKPESRILALTAHTSESVQHKCLAAGFNDYLTKPIHIAALLKSLKPDTIIAQTNIASSNPNVLSSADNPNRAKPSQLMM